MPPMAEPTENGDLSSPHEASNGFYSTGANPPPAWSNRKFLLRTHYPLYTITVPVVPADVGPVHKAPPAVATQLVVPTELSDGPVTLTCVHCQHHVLSLIHI